MASQKTDPEQQRPEQWTEQYEDEFREIVKRTGEGGGKKLPQLTVLDHLNRIAYALAAINQNLNRIANALEDREGLEEMDPLDDGSDGYRRGL